jgi:hypothetical protein
MLEPDHRKRCPALGSLTSASFQTATYLPSRLASHA